MHEKINKSAYTPEMAKLYLDSVNPFLAPKTATERQYYRFLDWCAEHEVANNWVRFLSMLLGCSLEEAVAYKRGEKTLEEVRKIKKISMQK